MLADDHATSHASTGALAALAARAQLGDRASMEALLRQLQRPLLDHIRGLVRHDELAQDVLQESLFIVCRRIADVREPHATRAWAYRIATREAVRAMRRARRDHADPLDDVPEPPAAAPDEPAVDRELLEQLPRWLDALPPAAGVVLRLRYLEGFTQPQIAAVLEIPVGTVKSRLAYGLAALRKDWTR